MPPAQKKPFYLYKTGIHPDLLCLGNLVLDDYANPLTARHYKHPRLSDDDLRLHTTTQDLRHNIFAFNNAYTPGAGLQIGDILNINFSITRHNKQTIVAPFGKRIILTDPSNFLTTHILANPTAKTELSKWLSATSRLKTLGYTLHPQIWMLTGLLTLTDARAYIAKMSRPTANAGLSSLPGAAAGVPLGGELSIEWEREEEVGGMVLGEQVWAAQWVRLDARYFRAGGGFPDQIPLLEGRVSKGHISRHRESSRGSGEEVEELKGPDTAVLRPTDDADDEWDQFLSVLEDCEEEMRWEDAAREDPPDLKTSAPHEGLHDLPLGSELLLSELIVQWRPKRKKMGIILPDIPKKISFLPAVKPFEQALSA
ncbi:hypothetical protein MMC30_008829 [Trapelia coarctata]|nr:hypothetical protein [Trapelia coarctata]